MSQMTIECPFNRNYRVELDKGEINMDDPGEGTPAMVYGPNGSCGTLYAAQGEGELACGPSVHVLPDSVTNWLNEEVDEIAENFLYGE